MRLVSLGDSFTEGVGDEQPDGSVRGWADLLAQGIATATGSTIQYANLAIRGRLLDPIIDEQLDPALALQPTHLTFNGGGNDMLRPRMNAEYMIRRTEYVVQRCLDAGVAPILLAGPNPGAQAGLPLGGRFGRRGTVLTAALAEMSARYSLSFVDNFHDLEIRKPGYWSEDRLHLNAAGHARIAANMLRGLGYPVTIPQPAPAPAPERNLASELHYWRTHVLPWATRHLQGRSSGDHRTAKYQQWIAVEPQRDSRP
ncbi:MAG: SGNH/GDSL hydrolase family protein [Candidatus Nanopelagicales bacterium]